MVNPSSDYPIVVGMGPSGLFLARQLRRLGCPVGAIARPGDVGISTNAITKGSLKVATNLDGVVGALDAIRGVMPERRPRLLMASDQYLTLLLQLDDSLLRLLGLTQGEINSYRLINDKAALEKILAPLSSIPRTFAACDVPPDAYPCVVKWNEKRIDTSSRSLPKVGIVYKQNELSLLLSDLEQEGFLRSDIVVQSYIPGNNGLQYSFGGYYCDGDLLAGICVNQVRQYPQGISSCVVESCGAEARQTERVARSIARELSFSGFLEVECKLDRTSGSPLVLDVNPRPWGWVSILGKKYPDFHQALLGGRPCPIDHPVIWRTLPRDFLADKNGQNVRPPWRGYVKCTDIVDRTDMRPFLSLGLTAMRKMMHR